MKTLFPILANLTMLALLCLVLVAFCERMANVLLTAQVRRNLSRAERGLDAAYSMKQYRDVYSQRRAMRIIAAVLIGGITLSSGTLYAVRANELVPVQSTRADYSRRNELLARAERMAKAGNKGLMRANITHAKSVGPVSADMVLRIESMLAH
jgi:hypothetical protein